MSHTKNLDVLEISCLSPAVDGVYTATVSFGCADRWFVKISPPTMQHEDVLGLYFTAPAQVIASKIVTRDEVRGALRNYGKNLKDQVCVGAPLHDWRTLGSLRIVGPPGLLSLYWETMEDPFVSSRCIGQHRDVVRIEYPHAEPHPIAVPTDSPRLSVLVVQTSNAQPGLPSVAGTLLHNLANAFPRRCLSVSVRNDADWELVHRELTQRPRRYHMVVFDGRILSLTKEEVETIDEEERAPKGARDHWLYSGFDGHRNCLLFNWPRRTDRFDVVDDRDFASLIRTAQVPLVVLTHGEPAECGVAPTTTQRLLDAGVQAVMSPVHDMHPDASRIFLEALFDAFLREKRPLADAATTARMALASNSSRGSPPQTVPDWVLPRLFQRSPADLVLKTAPLTHDVMLCMHVSMIPRADLSAILACIKRPDSFVDLGQALPCSTGMRQPHQLHGCQTPSEVVDVWAEDCGEKATIAVLREALVHRFYAAAEALDEWIRRSLHH